MRIRQYTISIIIPSFNQGNYLEKTLLSILDQNYSNLEIIVIDGGSLDNTLKVIKKYKQQISYWVSEQDRGQSHALNKGLKICKGEYIGWMNSDDLYWPNAISEFIFVANKYPNYDIYYANKVNIDKNDNFLRKVNYARPAKGYMQFYSSYRGMTFCNQATFFKASVFDDVGKFDEQFHICMDTDYFFRCIKKRKNFHFTNSIWGAWRQHESAKTATEFKRDSNRRRERLLFETKHNIYKGVWFRIATLLAAAYRRMLLLSQ